MKNARTQLLDKIAAVIEEFSIQYPDDIGQELGENSLTLPKNILDYQPEVDQDKNHISYFKELDNYFERYQKRTEKVIKILKELRSGEYDSVLKNTNLTNSAGQKPPMNDNSNLLIPPSYPLIVREKPESDDFPPSSQLILNFPKSSELKKENESFNYDSNNLSKPTQESPFTSRKNYQFKVSRQRNELSIKNVLNSNQPDKLPTPPPNESNKPIIKRISNHFSQPPKLNSNEVSKLPISLSQPPEKVKKIPSFLELYPPDTNEPLPPPIFFSNSLLSQEVYKRNDQLIQSQPNQVNKGNPIQINQNANMNNSIPNEINENGVNQNASINNSIQNEINQNPIQINQNESINNSIPNESNENPIQINQNTKTQLQINQIESNETKEKNKFEFTNNPFFKSQILFENKTHQTSEVKRNPFQTQPIQSQTNETQIVHSNSFFSNQKESSEIHKPKFNFFIKSNDNQKPKFNVFIKSNNISSSSMNQSNENQNEKDNQIETNQNSLHQLNASTVNQKVKFNQTSTEVNQNLLSQTGDTPFKVSQNRLKEIESTSNLKLQSHSSKTNLMNSVFNSNNSPIASQNSTNNSPFISKIPTNNSHFLSDSSTSNSPFLGSNSTHNSPFISKNSNTNSPRLPNQNKSPAFSPVITSPYHAHFISSTESSEPFVLTPPTSSQHIPSLQNDSDSPLKPEIKQLSQPQAEINSSEKATNQNSSFEEEDDSDSIADDNINSPIITVPEDFQQINSQLKANGEQLIDESQLGNNEQEIDESVHYEEKKVDEIHNEHQNESQDQNEKESESESSSELELSQLSQILQPSGFIYNNNPIQQMEKAFGSSENPYSKLDAITRLPISKNQENPK